jgi:hypothetical protein
MALVRGVISGSIMAALSWKSVRAVVATATGLPPASVMQGA